MQKNRRTAPARQANTRGVPPRNQPAKRQEAARRLPYVGSGTEVVDHLTASRAAELSITAERLIWIADWHHRLDASRHFLIAKRLRQIAMQLAVNDNSAMRRAA